LTRTLYDGGGKLVAEYTQNIAPPTTLQTVYMTADVLGSPRINTNQKGEVVARHDYLPFGDEIAGLGQRAQHAEYRFDDIRQKFTGYEKDQETGLDFAQARYYGNGLGRFTSVDPLLDSAKIGNPNSWNRYTYALNNPLRFTDPTGQVPTDFIDGDGNRAHIEDGKDQVFFATTSVIQAFQIGFMSNRELYYQALARYGESRGNLNMTVAEFDHLSGIIYAESSKNATDFREPAAIYSVLRNRANANGDSVLDEANKPDIAGNRRTDEIKDKNASKEKIRAVYKGIAYAAIGGSNGYDYSNGAYFWQGNDFAISSRNANKGFYQTGFKFTSEGHKIWKMDDHIADDKVKTGDKKYDYKYESTAAYGRTIFIRLTDAWMKANGTTRWNGTTK